MRTASSLERSKWHDYRGGGHAWLPVRDLGLQRSLCGYLASNARLTQPVARRCVLCTCMMEQGFATLQRACSSDSTTRVQDVRRVRDHLRRAVRILKTTAFDTTVCDDALAKLAAVEADLVTLFRLERLGTGKTADDESLG